MRTCYQFFSGREYYEPKAPCDFKLISRFRKLIGEEGVEELVAKTFTVAAKIGLLKPDELKRISTVRLTGPRESGDRCLVWVRG